MPVRKSSAVIIAKPTPGVRNRLDCGAAALPEPSREAARTAYAFRGGSPVTTIVWLLVRLESNPLRCSGAPAAAEVARRTSRARSSAR